MAFNMDENSGGKSITSWKPNSLGDLLQWPVKDVAEDVTLDVLMDAVVLTSANEAEERRSISNSTMEAFSQHSRRSSRSGGTLTTRIVPLTFSPDLWIDGSNNEEQKKPRLEKSLSVAEHAILGLRFINRATLTKTWINCGRRSNAVSTSLHCPTICSIDRPLQNALA